MPTARRIHVPAVGDHADANIRRRHPGEAAAWIWHPGARVDATAFLRFACAFRCDSACTVVVHVSADHRYQLALDGVEISYGPDRSDVGRWSVASLELRLEAGDHRLEALAWWLGEHAPGAQMSHRGGFLLAADGDFHRRLSTGVAPWTVVDLTPAVALTRKPMHSYHDIGPGFRVDAARWHAPAPAAAPRVVVGPVDDNPWGVLRPGWRLEPTPLPEQRREVVGGGRVRALADGADDAPVAERADPRIAAWQRLVDGGDPLTVPARTRVSALWDLGEYRCGYADLVVSGGRGATVAVEWAEALFEREADGSRSPRKGRRDAVDGKLFLGFGDELVADGGAERALPAFWWRSGRFVRVTVVTADEPIALRRLAVRTTGYPFAFAHQFASSDAALDAALPLMERGIAMCGHETWVDCPYYEQLQYVGDSRLTALASYATTRDDHLGRRFLELFDASRWTTGWIAERYPTGALQQSATYAMLWPVAVLDHLRWRGDRAFARARLAGVRAQVELALAARRDDGVLGSTPGWPFVDWVPGWPEGMGPGVRERAPSAIVSLHAVLALRAAEEIEREVGDAALAARCADAARALGDAIAARWWDERRGLVADEDSRARFSEHAQCLALIAGVLDPARAARCVDAWLAADDLWPASIYFSFYPLEALYRAGRGDALVRRLGFWAGLAGQGFTTPPEMPEPSRSDCHGWGSHPLWHWAASLAGIRPASPGLERVAIAPCPGPLTRVRARIPHPRGGDIAVDLAREGARWRVRVELPPGVAGEFRFAGATRALTAGATTIEG